MEEMIDDIATGFFGDNWQGNEPVTEESNLNVGDENPFLKLFRDAKENLYHGCEKASKLSFIVKMLHLKVTNGWSNKSFTELLQDLKGIIPGGENIPGSYHEAKKMIHDLGLGYIKIHACENNCILFRKEYEKLDNCPKCNTPRWTSDGKKRVARKVLRYFPLKPRLQRMFVNREVAQDMRWHKEKRKDNENLMSHPADSEAWKDFDKMHTLFASDPRNIRLGLATDGFNPFGNMSSTYSVWPVILVQYNLPPWKCMKDPFFIMSMLIPGPKSPGNDIDVFLQPLIDELIEFWENGAETYDAYSRHTFNLRAALLWTINDFPAYANLSGWSTRGKQACPVCMRETTHLYLPYSKKLCYQGSRKFLPTNHKWRREKRKFDGESESSEKPRPLSGTEIFNQVSKLKPVEFGKPPGNKRKRPDPSLNWTKKSIFWDLPYWKTLKLRHNLDVMHIEKNVCDNVLCTLMDIDGKTKDSWKSREDLKFMGIRSELHLLPDGNSSIMPPAPYTLSRDERRKVCEFLKSVKFPDGFASNTTRWVKMPECKIGGMKSHDSHVFLEYLLPLALRGILPRDICLALIELSHFFKELCAKTLHLDILENLQKQIVITLCKLEQIFPPSFFDVMVHLPIHLAGEAKLAGPVQFRWMYPIERYLRKLKGYVRNKAKPEGSIAEGYVHHECLTFCSMYLRDTETVFNRPERYSDGGASSKFGNFSVFSNKVKLLGGSTYTDLTLDECKKAHMYVLNNSDKVTPYIREHMEILFEESEENIQERHENEFSKWFERRITQEEQEPTSHVDSELLSLARGPYSHVARYKGCNTNGFKFHVADLEKNRKTQHSGVVVSGEHLGENIHFFGVLTDIIQLEYIGEHKLVLFKCKWWDVGNKRLGIRVDNAYKVTSVNTSRTWYKDQPYVLTSQVAQVYYVNDMSLGGNWKIVERIRARNTYNAIEELDKGSLSDDEPIQQNGPGLAFESENMDDEINVERADVQPGIRIDINLAEVAELETMPDYGSEDTSEEDNGLDDDNIEGQIHEQEFNNTNDDSDS